MSLSTTELHNIARELGHNWYAHEHHGNPAVARSDGLVIFFRDNSKKQWVIYSGAVMDGTRHIGKIYVDGEEVPSPASINVSQSKTPEQIAGDIKRRLLPDYEVYFKAAQDYLAAQAKATAERNAFLDELTEACGGDKLKDHSAQSGCSHLKESCTINVGSPGKDCGYGSIEVSTGSSCSIELRSVPRSVALEVAKLLHTHMPRH